MTKERSVCCFFKDLLCDFASSLKGSKYSTI